MKKTKNFTLIAIFLFTPFFAIVPILKTHAQTDTVGSADSYNGSSEASTDNSWVAQGNAASNNQQSSQPSSIMLGGGDSSYNTFNSNTSETAAATADNAAYQAKIKSLYTGYASSTDSQSSVGQSIGACIGAFVGKSIGSSIGGMFGGSSSGTSGTTQQVPTDDKKTNYREETLNGVAFCAGNALINLMSDQIVAWINSGFKNPDGTKGPSFLSNPGSFFKQVADREAGAFFQNLGPIGNVICKPFDLQIRLALLNDYKGGGQQQCSLTSIKQNFTNFGKGANGFSKDFFQLTQEDQNNAIGSYFIAREKMSEAIKYDIATNKMEIDLGKGFLNFKTCVKYSTTSKDPNTGKAQCSEWKTTTPGSEVQATLDRAMGSKTHRLEIATNFNQIVSALVGQIVQMAVKGLSGQADDSGNGSRHNTPENYGYPYEEIPNTTSTTSTSTATTSNSTASSTFDSGYGVI